MKNDLEILNTIKEELTKVNSPPFNPSMIEVYGKLVERVPEDGFELLVADGDLSEAEEQALRLLNRYEYVVANLRRHERDGYYYHVNMRSKRFHELTDNGMKDSGKREAFPSGAERDAAEGKPRPDLISPFATERLAEWLRLGAEKYAPRNWEKGLPVSRSMASLCRHLMKFQQGCTDEDHVAAIMCNAMFVAHTQEMCKRGVLPESLLDMPDYQQPQVHHNGDDPYDF